jgi:hypothetical protein
MNRFQLLLVLGLAACTAKKENANTTTNADTAQAKAKPPAVVILKQTAPDTLKGSLDAVATGKIGDAQINISYHSPAVRGRIIWGGLVPYDKVWVTGAHMATSIELSKDFLIGDTTVPAGKYALFSIPGKDEWIIIINKNWQQHLTDDYDQKQDVVRVKVKPEAEQEVQERLRYEIESQGNNEGKIAIYWEKLEISLPLKLK